MNATDSPHAFSTPHEAALDAVLRFHPHMAGLEADIATYVRALLSDPRVREAMARAIAWDDLTPHGRKTCRWPDDYSAVEVEKFRAEAQACIDALARMVEGE
jgi:hypothetical protein